MLSCRSCGLLLSPSTSAYGYAPTPIFFCLRSRISGCLKVDDLALCEAQQILLHCQNLKFRPHIVEI